MQKKSVYISAAAHVVLFVIATLSLPWLKRDFVIPPSVSVELVDVAQLTQTNKIAPTPQPKPVEKKEEPKPPPPPPAAPNQAQEATVPVKAEKKEEDTKKEEVVDKDAIPEKKKPKKEDKKKIVKEEPKKDFASVLKNLDVKKETPVTPDKQPDLNPDDKPAPTEQGVNAPIGEKLTMSEEDALRHQLEKCWNVPYGAKDAENLVVEIVMTINQDRTLQSARVADTARYNTDSFFRAAADSAMRAVRSPLCSPFEVPPDKYDTWKTTTVTFNPKEMF